MSAVGSSSTVHGSSLFVRLPRARRRAGSRRRRPRAAPCRRRRGERASSIASAVGVAIVSTPAGRWHREVRGEQDDLGSAPARLLGERDAHPARRAVADEAHRVDRLARSAGGDEHALAGERAGASSCSTRAAISSGSAIRPTPHSPSAVSPSSGPTSSTPRERSVSTFARVAACAHMRGFIAGATSTGPRWASAASVSTLSASPCASFASVFAVHGATTSRSARVEVRVEVLVRRAAARARGRSRRARTARRPA